MEKALDEPKNTPENQQIFLHACTKADLEEINRLISIAADAVDERGQTGLHRLFRGFRKESDPESVKVALAVLLKNSNLPLQRLDNMGTPASFYIVTHIGPVNQHLAAELLNQLADAGCYLDQIQKMSGTSLLHHTMNRKLFGLFYHLLKHGAFFELHVEDAVKFLTAHYDRFPDNVYDVFRNCDYSVTSTLQFSSEISQTGTGVTNRPIFIGPEGKKLWIHIRPEENTLTQQHSDGLCAVEVSNNQNFGMLKAGEILFRITGGSSVVSNFYAHDKPEGKRIPMRIQIYIAGENLHEYIMDLTANQPRPTPKKHVQRRRLTLISPRKKQSFDDSRASRRGSFSALFKSSSSSKDLNQSSASSYESTIGSSRTLQALVSPRHSFSSEDDTISDTDSLFNQSQVDNAKEFLNKINTHAFAVNLIASMLSGLDKPEFRLVKQHHNAKGRTLVCIGHHNAFEFGSEDNDLFRMPQMCQPIDQKTKNYILSLEPYTILKLTFAHAYNYYESKIATTPFLEESNKSRSRSGSRIRSLSLTKQLVLMLDNKVRFSQKTIQLIYSLITEFKRIIIEDDNPTFEDLKLAYITASSTINTQAPTMASIPTLPGRGSVVGVPVSLRTSQQSAVTQTHFDNATEALSALDDVENNLQFYRAIWAFENHNKKPLLDLITAKGLCTKEQKLTLLECLSTNIETMSEEIYLKISDFNANIKTHLEPILHGMPKLRFLDLSNCKAVSDWIWPLLEKHCPELKTLILKNTNITKFSQVNLPKLTHIDFSNCSRLTLIKSFRQRRSGPSNFVALALREVILNHCLSLNKISLYGDSLIKMELTNCKQLESLSLSSGQAISNLNKLILDGCVLLQDVNVDIDNDKVEFSAIGCTRITSLAEHLKWILLKQISDSKHQRKYRELPSKNASLLTRVWPGWMMKAVENYGANALCGISIPDANISGEKVPDITGSNLRGCFAINTIFNGDTTHANMDKLVKEYGQTLTTQLNGELAISVTLSHDNSVMAVGTDSGKLQLYDTDYGDLIVEYHEHKREILTMTFTYENGLIITGSEDRTIKIWDPALNESLKTIEEHTDAVRAFALHPDKKCFASGSEDRHIEISDIESNNTHVLVDPKASVTCMHFNNDGTKIAVGYINGPLCVYYAKTNKRIKLFEYSDNQHGITAITFSPDGKTLYATSKKGVLYRFKTSEPNDYSQLKLKNTYKITPHDYSQVKFSPDAKKVFVLEKSSSKVRVFDTYTGNWVHTISGLPENITCIELSTDASKLLVAGDNFAHLWLVKDLTPTQSTLASSLNTVLRLSESNANDNDDTLSFAN